MSVQGFDVSSNNGLIDWENVDVSTYKFVFIKALEGVTFHDVNFARNYAGAKSKGLFRGAYNFARPKTSFASQEAQAFVQVVEAAGGFQLPPVLDMEDAGGLAGIALQTWCEEWANYIKLHTGRRPILYTSSSFNQTYRLDALASSFDFWVASYSTVPPTALGKWGTWDFWQHTDAGRVRGISGAVDLDVFNGTLDELQTRFLPQTPEAPSPSTVAYPSIGVEIDGKPSRGIVVGDATYVHYTALDLAGIPYQLVKNEQGVYKGVIAVNGVHVQGVIYGGTTWLPWTCLHPNKLEHKNAHLWNFVIHR